MIPLPECVHVADGSRPLYCRGRCRSCYDKAWRATQDEFSAYLARARTPKTKRRAKA